MTALSSDPTAGLTTANPANAPAKTVRPARVPMSLPTLKLATPEIPGYVCYWFRGTPSRIQQALSAGYAFVERDEVMLAGRGLATSYSVDGNADLGSRVSVSTGDDTSSLYLMKIQRELWDEDGIAVAEKHEQIAAQLRGDRGFSEGGMDASNRYSKGENRNMFTPRKGL